MSEETIRIAARGLALEFRRDGDRWSHDLVLGPAGSAARVVRSFDPPADLAEPGRVVSPSYQELQIHDDGGTHPRILLVGQAGLHHFSAVFALAESSEGLTLEIDVADRCRSAVLGLAATYLVDLPAGDLRDADAERLAWAPATVGGTLVLEALAPTRLALGEAGRRATRVQADAPIDVALRTHRLAYRWRRMA